MALLYRFACKLSRDYDELIVPTAAFGALVADMLRRLVNDLEGLRVERGEALLDLARDTHV